MSDLWDDADIEDDNIFIRFAAMVRHRRALSVTAERVIVNAFGEQVIDRLPDNRDHGRVQSAYHDECLPLVVVV